jgi:hypothetical protein
MAQGLELLLRSRESLGGGRALRPPAPVTEGPQKILFFLPNSWCRMLYMTWHTLPHEPRKLQATEARLDAIYQAARKGLKGDTLALAAGMQPVEYRQLCQFDQLAEMAEQKGRADGEMEVSGLLHDAARAGDAKAALAILQHTHGWTAKQEITIDVYQKISITQALADAQSRLIEHDPTESLNKELMYGTTADL